MLKMLRKIAEKYAKVTNTACWIICAFHQPKMPASLIKKDQYWQSKIKKFYQNSLKKLFTINHQNKKSKK